jgi:hypothetical protein
MILLQWWSIYLKRSLDDETKESMESKGKAVPVLLD